MFPDVKPGLRSFPEVLRDKLRLRRLEAGRNKVSLRDGSFKWIPAVAGMTGGGVFEGMDSRFRGNDKGGRGWWGRG